MIQENQEKAQDQDEYQNLTAKYNAAKEELEKAKAEKSRKKAQALKLDSFLESLKKAPESVTEWNECQWNLLLESGKVNRDGTITFRFRNGKEITK